jgi:hypothetical protein
MLGVAVAVGADREQLHQLAPVVLVRRVLGVVRAREPEQHRRVLRDGLQQRRERSERVPAEELVLADHQPGVADVLRGGEPVVPDERHALGEGAARAHHPVEPPELVVSPCIERRERVTVVVVRLGASETFAARVRQLVDGAVEPELREPLGLARPWPETGTPEQALGLRLTEVPSVDGDGHPGTLSAPGRTA